MGCGGPVEAHRNRPCLETDVVQRRGRTTQAALETSDVAIAKRSPLLARGDVCQVRDVDQGVSIEPTPSPTGTTSRGQRCAHGEPNAVPAHPGESVGIAVDGALQLCPVDPVVKGAAGTKNRTER